MIDLKKTLNLPSTKFPMKANLPVKELEIQKEWKETDIYNEMQTYRKDSPLFILHDGPPYANGNIHIGHAVNKILKDIILKSKFLSGFKTPYIPGWDCHGLPIELEVEKISQKKTRYLTKNLENYVANTLTNKLKNKKKILLD